MSRTLQTTEVTPTATLGRGAHAVRLPPGQVADRAHRIGQDKPVFVYKLVAQGTVEERMLELQQRKKALAAGIYNAAGGTGAGLEAGDIERLFEPLG
jgi:SNF2 family DNA or RNA helicase